MNLSWSPCIHASSSRTSRMPPAAEPALFTRMSSRPRSAAAPVTKRSASSVRVRSAQIASTLRPDSARISAAAFSSTSRRRAQIATSQPSRANARAMPLPIPSLPPVTKAALPVSRRSMALLLQAAERLRVFSHPPGVLPSRRVVAGVIARRGRRRPVSRRRCPPRSGDKERGMGGTARGNVVAGASSRDRLVGQPVLRTEDARFVTGTGCFVDDFTREGMCHAVVVRSAVAHARLTGIRRATALQRPGVLTVLIASDLGYLGGPIPIRIAPLPGFDRYLQEPLARDRVRYVGEPVAVVIAEDRGAADDAAELVTPEYELLDPVVDVHQAMTDESVLHERA